MISMACTHPALSTEAPSRWSTRRLALLLDHMVAEGDARAEALGRHARRTLQEMAPGYTRQPVLTLHGPQMADDSCPLCTRWGCDGTNCPPGAAGPTPTNATTAPHAAGGGQCQNCGTWFDDWNGGTCDACRMAGH
ncbi:hypothetical protein ACIRTB_21135 [Streptomyces sp. NPDC101158]|uniref:hypothetical protein n=1 Tax=Streptomyces sp. NPDC101158 TaxID=3366117 RepID=UPI003826A696